MIVELHNILPDKADRLKFSSERLLINPDNKIAYNDYLNFQSKLYDIINDIQNQRVTLEVSVNNLSYLLKNYNENAFDDIAHSNIIPLIILNLRIESMNCSFFIQFLLVFLEKLTQSCNFELINSFVTPETIKFLCHFLKDSINNQRYPYSTQKYALKSLLIILQHHQCTPTFFSDPKYELLTTLIFVFKRYIDYTNGNCGYFRFNISQIYDQQIQDLFQSSILIISCFSLFFSVTDKINISVIKILIEAAQSHCFQVNNEALAALIKCSERFPMPFFHCFHQSYSEKILTSLLDPNTINDDNTHILALDIIANITSQLANDDIFQFLINTQIMTNFSELLRTKFEIYVLPISLILIDFICKSKIALTSILNAEPKIVQNILNYFSPDLRNKDKCAILYLYASCVVSFDNNICPHYLPFFIDIGMSNSIFSELIEVIDSTQSEKMVLLIIQCIVRLLDFTFLSQKKIHNQMINNLTELISIDVLDEVSQISDEHRLWTAKLVEIVKSNEA